MSAPRTLPVAIGLVLGALVLGGALIVAVDRFRAAERYVTVKGLAERELPADLAIWPLTFEATGETPAAVQAALARSEVAVRAFLTGLGFGDAELGKSPPRLTDTRNQGFPADRAPEERYRAEITLTLRSPRIEAVAAAAQRADELVGAGVVLTAQWGDPVQYLFSGLAAVKPSMIAEATADARSAARRFAEDSGARVGGIRRATQGYFSIEDRDRWTPEIKRVRVVTTVDWFLDGG